MSQQRDKPSGAGEMGVFRSAMELAAKNRMRFMAVHYSENVADIFCAKCGWPEDHRETVLEKYVQEPYGCARCAGHAQIVAENFKARG